MSERIYITGTGERVRELDGLVEIGLSLEAQAQIGAILQFQPPKIGTTLSAGECLFVVEGTLTAAEFYAPVSGMVVFRAGSGATISDVLVVICKS